MPLLAGVLLAFGVGLFATAIGLDRDRAFYPTVMMVIASSTRCSRSWERSTHALVLESRCRAQSSLPLQWLASSHRSGLSPLRWRPMASSTLSMAASYPVQRTGLLASVLYRVECHGRRVSGAGCSNRSDSKCDVTFDAITYGAGVIGGLAMIAGPFTGPAESLHVGLASPSRFPAAQVSPGVVLATPCYSDSVTRKIYCGISERWLAASRSAFWFCSSLLEARQVVQERQAPAVSLLTRVARRPPRESRPAASPRGGAGIRP